MAAWRLWWTFALNDIRQRYRRSFLGQFWITLSTGIFIAALGIVYSTLFKIQLGDYFMYLATNFVVWTYLATTINEACTAFTAAEGFLKQERLPKSIFIFRVVLRNLIVLAHNLVIIAIVYLFYGDKLGWGVLAAIPGFFLVTLNITLAALIISIFATRFRDLSQIIANFTQVAFFVTPIMWRTTQLPPEARWFVAFNPIADHLAVACGPLLGTTPSVGNFVVTVAVTLCLGVAALILFQRFRERIVYWL